MEKDSYGQCGAKIPNSEVGFKSVGTIVVKINTTVKLEFCLPT